MQDLSAILGLKADPVASGRCEGVPGDNKPFGEVLFPEPVVEAGLSTVRKVGFALVFSLAACATASAPDGPAFAPLTAPALSLEEQALDFALDAPEAAARGPRMKLWATHYHTPVIRPAAETISAAFPLIGRDDSPISAPLLQRDWCEAALQGSVSIRTSLSATAYVYIDSNGPEQTNCDQWLGSLSDGVKNATRRARFMKVTHALGCGVRNHPLVPFRTIAVDPSVIPLESVIFVPELRGREITVDGRTLTHDGYLFAGDRGGAIRGNHIDVFLNAAGSSPLEDLFASTDARTFAAHVIDADDSRAKALRATQAASCGPVTPD